MATLRLLSATGEVIAEHTAPEPFLGFKDHVYSPGEAIELAVDAPGLYRVQFDDTLGAQLVWIGEETVRYEVILDPRERRPYPQHAFDGPRHFISARPATRDELSGRRNVALNPYDRADAAGIFPHASANLGPDQDPAFRARNAIDGVIANTDHGSYPFQAWGIDRRTDAELRIDFGREVVVDELAVVLRADWPHDSWWRGGRVAFSDRSVIDISLRQTGNPQHIAIEPVRTSSVLLCDLVKNDDPSEFPALTQLVVYGRESE